MDIFDRYLRMLRIFLPKAQRDDIRRELTEEIRSQVATREAELGRPLSTDERAAVVGPLPPGTGRSGISSDRSYFRTTGSC